ncbi:MAG TPA: hypothetical protein VHJ16_15790, partial [Xanthobacteraceae bacterium]|nr:hypothetical protein [Xanthobacteraceae bacterium]
MSPQFSLSCTRRIADRRKAALDHVAPAELRLGDDAGGLLADPSDDRTGRAGRRHQAEEGARRIVRIAELDQRRRIGQQRHAAHVIDRQRPHRPGLQVRDEIGDADERDRRRARQDRIRRIAAAAERHADD